MKKFLLSRVSQTPPEALNCLATTILAPAVPKNLILLGDSDFFISNCHVERSETSAFRMQQILRPSGSE
jgi:hypothetical protein